MRGRFLKYSNWNIINKFPDDIVGSILGSRGIKAGDEFLETKYESLCDPFLFNGMLKAVRRTKKAIADREKVGLFMDYDADGICGGAIVYKSLCPHTKVEYYIPHRREGYGLSCHAIDVLHKSGCKLILTVDCGIRNNTEIDYANTLKIDVIVLDHHELPEIMPNTYATIHPKTSKKLKFKDYSGGGVAYNFVRALDISSGREKWDAELAAISTVADMVPLVGDNRILVKFGLIVLNKTRNWGLDELIKIAGLRKGEIGTYEIGFQIAPRINATGRVEDPVSSFKLLTETDREEIKILGEKLNHLNSQRQAILERCLKEAEQIIKQQNKDKDKIIIIKSDNFSEGVIGLVAGKVADKYYRPSIVFTKHDGFYKGSARSIPGVDITNVISLVKDEIITFGGHPGAAGLSVLEEKFNSFCRKIQRQGECIDKTLFSRKLDIDALIKSEQVDLKLAKTVNRLEPFGFKNKRPIFAIEELRVYAVKKIGKNMDHLKISLCKESIRHDCVAFSAVKNGWELSRDDLVDVAFSLNINRWNNREKIDLIIEDIKNHDK